jgi:hypothetical protein
MGETDNLANANPRKARNPPETLESQIPRSNLKNRQESTHFGAVTRTDLCAGGRRRAPHPLRDGPSRCARLGARSGLARRMSRTCRPAVPMFWQAHSWRAEIPSL